MGMLDPSWLQLKRVLTCGQVLILCCARREVHQLEAVDLFHKLVTLIEAHVEFWPVAAQAVAAYKTAAACLGVHLPETPLHREGSQNQNGDTLSFSELGADPALANWSGLFLDLDMDAFAPNPDITTSW